MNRALLLAAWLLVLLVWVTAAHLAAFATAPSALRWAVAGLLGFGSLSALGFFVAAWTQQRRYRGLIVGLAALWLGLGVASGLVGFGLWFTATDGAGLGLVWGLYCATVGSAAAWGVRTGLSSDAPIAFPRLAGQRP